MFRYPNRIRVPFIDETGELVTVQSAKAECDINNIVNTYKKTGIIKNIKNTPGEYLALPSETDYQLALNTIIEGQTAFDALPSVVREKFKNDPAIFLSALSLSEYDDYFREVGIKNPKPQAPAPAPAPAPKAPKAPASSPEPTA